MSPEVSVYSTAFSRFDVDLQDRGHEEDDQKAVEEWSVSGKTVLMDATFVKAHSKRDPHDNSRGSSDPDARVGRNGKTFELGYKLHVAADSKSELPVAIIVAPANENEKKHASKRLFDKALRATEERMNTLVADSQYSSRKLRDETCSHGVRAVILSSPFVPTRFLKRVNCEG